MANYGFHTTALGSGRRAESTYSVCDLGHRLDHAVTGRIIPGCLVRFSETRVEGSAGVSVFDYVAIGVLIVLAVWGVADWIPRGKL
jgi:hypothetical protein